MTGRSNARVLSKHFTRRGAVDAAMRRVYAANRAFDDAGLRRRFSGHVQVVRVSGLRRHAVVERDR